MAIDPIDIEDAECTVREELADWGLGTVNASLPVLLAEYDRRGRAERELTTHWYRDRDEMLQLQVWRNAALALHPREVWGSWPPAGALVVCGHCRAADGEPAAYPCATVQALGGAS